MHNAIGVILAGGAGRRIGGSKAVVRLGGKPLICYPLAAMQAVLDEVTVLAKADTQLPPMPGVTVWVEPAAEQHPLIGIRQALALAEGRSVLACACDLPLVSSELVSLLAAADPGGAPAVIAAAGGEMQPLLGCYRPEAAAALGSSTHGSLREAVAAIGPRLLEVPDPELLFNVNTPFDLLQAGDLLSRT